MIYEFEITLIAVGVPVSRTLHIEKHASFADFHEAIQAAFDWTDSHLFNFFMKVSDGNALERVSITMKSSGMFQDSMNGSTFDYEDELLSIWFKQSGDKALYIYDFGDDWMHEIEFVQELEVADEVDYPICTAAENYAPPEDSRFQVNEGMIDLVAEDNKRLLLEVNMKLDLDKYSSKDLIDMGEEDFFDEFDPLGLQDESEADELMMEAMLKSDHLANITKNNEVTYSEAWEETLAKAKEFLQKKPWEVLGENDIFVMKEPTYNKMLFCKVVGESEDTLGLEIYFGWEGFFALLAIFSGEELVLDGMQHERALFVTFEDRTDLDKVDYKLIKTHSTTFRGKKSWPVFTSFRPGFFPWGMDEEEAAYTRVAMREVLHVMEERAAGQTLPHIVEDEKILLREVDKNKQDSTEFVSFVVDVEELIDEEIDEELVLSEIELKRLSKIKHTSPVSIEFTILPLEMPVQKEEGDRPFFPFLSLAVDADSGEVYFHEIVDAHIDLYSSQQAFLRVMNTIGSIPSEVATDHITARSILPFLDVCDFGFSIEEELEMTTNVIEGLMEFILDELLDEE